MEHTKLLAAKAAAPIDIDGRLRDAASLLLVDYLALSARGALAGSARAARDALRTEGATGDAAIVEGTGARASLADAALLNGLAAHGLDFDDTYEPASLHAGAAVWPAVLALVDRRDVAWDEALAAAIAGYDVMCEVGLLLGGRVAYDRGFHPTGVCGVFGAAAAAGRLLGLDADAMVDALGIASSAASGTLEWVTTGAWTKRIHPGQAAAAGIRAAHLAAAGFRGPETGIEGPNGFLHAYGSGRAEHAGGLAVGAGVLGTSVKFYPTCRYTHGCIDLLREAHAGGRAPVERIAAVRCGVLRAGHRLVAEPIADKRRVRGHVDAQFSMPFTAALALTRGDVTLADLERAADLAPALQPLMDRVEVHASDRLERAFPDRWSAEASIELDDGSVVELAEPSFRGSPGAPSGRSDVVEKAATLVGRSHAEDLAAAVLDHDAGGSVSASLEAVRGRSLVAEGAALVGADLP